MTEYMHIAVRVCCVCKIFQAPEHQLYERTTGYLYVNTIVMKMEKDKVSHTELC